MLLFLQLIDSFAWEICSLRKEMGEKRKTSDGDQNILTEVGALFLQTSDGQRALGASDSGYASLQRRLTILDRVTHTHSVWLLLPLSQQGANRILQGQPPGTFLVRRSSSLQRKVICLRASRDAAAPVREFPIKESQCNHILERAMHKCVLKPLRPTISAALQDFQVRSGAWQQLKENLSLAKAQPPQEMGVVDMCPPDAVAIEKIRTKLLNMCALYSPEEKVRVLLSVCKLIYTLMEDAAGRLCGADDFLPMLTYVLAQCDLPEMENQVLYMMELLDPLLLHGEGGYYLTSTYGALSLIKNFQEEQAARVLSSETKDTLKQWHRRRTTQRPSIEDFQNYLRVALQELDSGCTAKTLQVRPNATVRDVCRLCALKFKVLNPESYGLFLVMGGSCQQLAPDTHPQKLKAELHSNPTTAPFHFVFRRHRYPDPYNVINVSRASDLHELLITT
uniref:Ras and Rab interactor 2 n=1 Tax=Oryzias latipes TaxID=8090 RepID=A0A3P9K986_ORYLA